MAGLDRAFGIHYGSIAFFTSILHNVFLLYHIETFVSIFKIDKVSFWLGETIFLVWNSCNDPLFGWISDRHYLSAYKDDSKIVLARIKALMWNGPLFALSFLLFWTQWSYPAVQFVVCLCLYDSFLTMIDLHHSSLLADLTLSADERTSLNFYSSVFGALGALSVFVSYVVWDTENPGVFQTFCFAMAVVSFCGFIYVTRALRNMYLKRSQKSGDKETKRLNTSDSAGITSDQKKDMMTFIRELAGHKNFVWFAIMNLVQVFHCHFNSNFFPLFLENLLGDDVPQFVCSLILGVSFVAPHINNLYFLTLCRKFGTYSVVRGLFMLKMCLGIFMFLMGPNNMWLLALFIASNRVFTEGTCKLLSLIISDLVDEDFVINHRKSAVSAMMFGTAAFLSKPGQTLAPLVGTWLLATYTGHDVFQSGKDMGSIKLSLSTLDSDSQEQYRLGIFHLLVYLPVVCALVQLLAWANFSLTGSHLRWIKNIRFGSKYTSI